MEIAHRIGNRSTQLFQAACELQSHRRWCLTGTPIVNSLDDYGALLTFIKMEPFDKKSAFDHWISKPVAKNSPGALRRLRILIEATCLRRTKSVVPQKLPPCTICVEKVRLSPSDQALHDFFRHEAATNAAGLSIHQAYAIPAAPQKKRNVLSLINNLRRICDHGENLLSSSNLERWRVINSQAMNLQMTDLGVMNYIGTDWGIGKYDSLSTWAESSQRAIDTTAKTPPSAKVERLIRNLRVEQNDIQRGSATSPVKRYSYLILREIPCLHYLVSSLVTGQTC